MHRQNHRRRSRIAGALAAAILYGAVLAFASGLKGPGGAQATVSQVAQVAPAQVEPLQVAASRVTARHVTAPQDAPPATGDAVGTGEDPLATIAIAGIGVAAAGLWHLRHLARRRPRPAPVRLQPVVERVRTPG